MSVVFHGPSGFLHNETDRLDITEILLKRNQTAVMNEFNAPLSAGCKGNIHYT
jgi:hypothetical protein